jgi:hypothetical protein
VKRLIIILAFALALTGCGTLDPSGPYAGDKTLYQADQTIATSYAVLDSFLQWEKHVGRSKPDVHALAEQIRREGPNWFRSATAIRDAYAAEPTPEKRKSLQSALAILQTALNEASVYLLENKRGELKS